MGTLCAIFCNFSVNLKLSPNKKLRTGLPWWSNSGLRTSTAGGTGLIPGGEVPHVLQCSETNKNQNQKLKTNRTTEAGTINIPIFQRRKLRHRQVKTPVLGHTASNHQSMSQTHGIRIQSSPPTLNHSTIVPFLY